MLSQAQTNIFDQNVFASKLYYKLEDLMIRYPPQLRKYVEQDLRHWKAKYQEAEAFSKQCLVTQEKQRIRICELLNIQTELEALKAKVQKGSIAAINKEMLMKKQIHDLHVQLGKSDDQAWYQTHIDIQEYDSLLAHMSQTHIVKQFIEA